MTRRSRQQAVENLGDGVCAIVMGSYWPKAPYQKIRWDTAEGAFEWWTAKRRNSSLSPESGHSPKSAQGPPSA